MPVPSAISELDTNEANNSPPGGESAKGNIDNYLRAHAAFIRQLSNALDTANATLATTTATANSAVQLPAGTSMVFVQTAAPTGWTKSTAHNDKALRVVSGTAGSGGSLGFTTAFTSRVIAGSVGSTTLSESQMPPHTHSMPQLAGNPGGSLVQWFQGVGNTNSPQSTNSAGGGASHSHSFTGTSLNMAVQYVDSIIATKDA